MEVPTEEETEGEAHGLIELLLAPTALYSFRFRMHEQIIQEHTR